MVLVVVVVGIAAGASFFDATGEMQDEQSQAADYCNETYANATAVWVDSSAGMELHCELENGTLVEIPDAEVER